MTASKAKSDSYLGDGVYATFNGWQLWLDLRDQDDSQICLEREVWEALQRYMIRMGVEPIDPKEARE
jgi:hypothetical protein